MLLKNKKIRATEHFSRGKRSVLYAATHRGSAFNVILSFVSSGRLEQQGQATVSLVVAGWKRGNKKSRRPRAKPQAGGHGRELEPGLNGSSGLANVGLLPSASSAFKTVHFHCAKQWK